jgi:hypothetical protein
MTSPRVPTPESRRGRSLEIQLADRSDGRFADRYLEFAYPALPPFTFSTARVQVPSMGTGHIRILAMRTTLLATSDAALTGLELASLLLRLQVGAANDLIVTSGGNPGNFCSFAILNQGSPDPWFYFASPPRLVAGDTLQATVTNGAFLEAGAAPTLTPEVTLKIMDDAVWRRLYEIELAAELDAAAAYEAEDE